MFERTDALLDSFLNMGIPGNDIVVYRDGTCVHRRYGGCSDVESKIPMNGQERYNIYSCSKLITCTAALQLWEKGLFSLDDPLYCYLPEYETMQIKTDQGVRPAENPILVRHLFEMTAGFSYDVTSDWIRKAKQLTDGRCPTRETIRCLAEEPLCFEPGTQWKYSLCHDVLAALVEVLSGERFGEYVRTHIFEPLQMNLSTFSLPEEDVQTLAAQYIYNGEKRVFENCGKQIQFYKFGPDYESGGAGCISCVDDYITFLEAIRTGDRILKKETIAMMAADRVMCRLGDSPELKNRGYGLGVRCRHEASPSWYSEFGWGGAAGAYFVIDIPRKMTAFYVQHVLTPPMHELRPMIYQRLAEDLDGAIYD